MISEEACELALRIFARHVNPHETPQNIASLANSCIEAAQVFSAILDSKDDLDDDSEDYEAMRRDNKWK